jgi:hypothetical protein
MVINSDRHKSPPSGTIVVDPRVPTSAGGVVAEVSIIGFDLDSDVRDALVVDGDEVTEQKFLEKNQVEFSRYDRQTHRAMSYASGDSYDFHIDLRFSDARTVTVNYSESSWRINGYLASYERSYSVGFGDGAGEEDRLVPRDWPEECIGSHFNPDR